MELFTFTKITAADANKQLNQMIVNINAGLPATQKLGKVTCVKAFANRRINGELGHDEAQIIGRALFDDLNDIIDDPKRNDKNRQNAAKALALFKTWRKAFHTPKAEAPAPTKPRVVAQPNGTVAAASLEDLTAMVLTLTATVNTLVARS